MKRGHCSIKWLCGALAPSRASRVVAAATPREAFPCCVCSRHKSRSSPSHNPHSLPTLSTPLHSNAGASHRPHYKLGVLLLALPHLLGLGCISCGNCGVTEVRAPEKHVPKSRSTREPPRVTIYLYRRPQSENQGEMKKDGFKHGPVIPAGQGGRLLRLLVSLWGYSSMLISFVIAWFLLVRAGGRKLEGERKGGLWRRRRLTKGAQQ